jgi:hypothetical protein
MPYYIAMNTTDKVIVKFRSRSPRLLFSAYYNGVLLASSSNAQDLGEDYARKYDTEWILQDGNKYYTQGGVK